MNHFDNSYPGHLFIPHLTQVQSKCTNDFALHNLFKSWLCFEGEIYFQIVALASHWNILLQTELLVQKNSSLFDEIIY